MGKSSGSYAIIEAPSNLGLRPTGVEKLSERLLAHGLAERLQARRAFRLEPPAMVSSASLRRTL